MESSDRAQRRNEIHRIVIHHTFDDWQTKCLALFEQDLVEKNLTDQAYIAHCLNGRDAAHIAKFVHAYLILKVGVNNQQVLSFFQEVGDLFVHPQYSQAVRPECLLGIALGSFRASNNVDSLTRLVSHRQFFESIFASLIRKIVLCSNYRECNLTTDAGKKFPGWIDEPIKRYVVPEEIDSANRLKSVGSLLKSIATDIPKTEKLCPPSEVILRNLLLAYWGELSPLELSRILTQGFPV